MRVHLFPFRTQKLSSPVPTILAWRRAGKIGQCQHKKEVIHSDDFFFCVFIVHEEGPSVSLRLGHAAALTCPRHVIHSRGAASLLLELLPLLYGRKRVLFVEDGSFCVGIVFVVHEEGPLCGRKEHLSFSPRNGLVGVHFLFARSKRKWTQRESTPKGGRFRFLPPFGIPLIETAKEGTSPLL